MTTKENKVLCNSELFYVDVLFLIKICSDFTSYKKGKGQTHRLSEKKHSVC